MKGQNFASQELSRHTFRISRKKGSDFFYHRGTLKEHNHAFAHALCLIFGQVVANSKQSINGVEHTNICLH